VTVGGNPTDAPTEAAFLLSVALLLILFPSSMHPPQSIIGIIYRMALAVQLVGLRDIALLPGASQGVCHTSEAETHGNVPWNVS
jgi:hypothetical protein